MYQSDTSVMVENPVVFTLLYGICFSKITNKLIIAHMSKTGLEVFDRIFLGPVFYIILSKFVLSQELSLWARGYLLGIRNGFERVRTMTFLVWKRKPTSPFPYISLTYVIIDLLYYMTNVYKEIADHLNIKVFTIPYKMLVNESGSSSEATAKVWGIFFMK